MHGLEKDERCPNLYWLNIKGERKLATKNLVPGFKSVGEEIIKIKGTEYRIWNPYHSKAAAALYNNISLLPLKEGQKILYLGIAEGTTASYLSDIIGWEGAIFGVDCAYKPFEKLLGLSSIRKNILPILSDARNPQSYLSLVPTVDVIYCDVAQPDEVDISIWNAKSFLRKGGFIVTAIKASSIDVVLPPGKVFQREINKYLDEGFQVVEKVELNPFEKNHMMVIIQFK